MKPIYIESGVIIYYGNRVGWATDGMAMIDPMFKKAELNAFLEKQNIHEIKWMDGIFDRLTNDSRELHEMRKLKDCRVWQLKPNTDIRIKFIDYDKLCQEFGPPDPANYQIVFDGKVETNDLEALYTKFNTDHPPGGHSLSMSDVLELYDNTQSTFYYVDRFGFQTIEFENAQSVMEEVDPVLEFHNRIDAEYEAYIKQMEARPQTELIREAAKIAEMTALHDTLENNSYLDFDMADALNQLEQPLEAIWKKLSQEPVIPEQVILDAYYKAGADVMHQDQETDQNKIHSVPVAINGQISGQKFL